MGVSLVISVLLIHIGLCMCGRRQVGVPHHGNLNETSEKITYKIEQYQELGIPLKKRNLIIYHVAHVKEGIYGMDVATNNIKLFVSALLTHNDGSPQDAFYLFNVVDGKENPYRSYLPTQHPNVGIIDWQHVNEEMDLNMRTLRLLGLPLINSFKALFFMSIDVRGPLLHRNNGEWIVEFRKLLDANNVGMVGPMITCEGSPHVSTYMFAWRSRLFNLLWEDESALEHLGNSDFVRSNRFNISSVLYDRKYRTKYFDGRCALGCGSHVQSSLNPFSWCNILPKEVIFTYWGGDIVRSLGYMCKHTLALMRDTLANIADAHPEMGLVVPETHAGGRLYEMYKEYNEELYMDRIRPKAQLGHVESMSTHTNISTLNTAAAGADTDDLVEPVQIKPKKTGRSFSLFSKPSHTHSSLIVKKSSVHGVGGVGGAHSQNSDNMYDNTEVCFAVRTAYMHDSSEEVQSKTMFEDVNIDGFILSLLRQTNPLWVGYFFVTDTNPFEQRLQDILNKYQDPRLVYTPIPNKYRIQFTTEDAGYTATDYVMSKMVARRECRWVSATNADNVYGSAVVDRVLNVKPMAISKKIPDMLLNPIDSRNFMWADYLERRDLTRGLGVEQTWTDYCTGLEAALLFNSYTYTVQPSPVLGKVDLASVFYSREKYEASNMQFGNFTDPARFPCLGCQDGYLTQYLVQNMGWSYSRLSIDGLKSIIFHGPSPTLCIAAGNVWFDYPAVNRVGCISQQTVRMLSYHNPKYYDWIHLNFKANKFCLRLSRTGFFSETGH